MTLTIMQIESHKLERREEVVDLQLLSNLTGISLALGLNQILMRVEEYMSLMDENCRMATH